ncbi:group II intron reverse transcriptase/maturase [Microcoleus sp. BROC3]|uniref:group II intron reverse transcriptase/maturase n=1 Tax=Microcoleus sp. BROC3 TaxID=3055323 RepID=UPI00404083FC
MTEICRQMHGSFKDRNSLAMNKSKTRDNPTVEWNQINWLKAERLTFKLQKRIYRASERGDVKAVRKLQKTLINSWSNKALAVRRVTQDNTGKRTAGVDGIKLLTPKQRIKLVNQLKTTGKSQPTRRVMIPKPGTNESRSLGIPTMYDRALQAVVKAALEPEWEARFEPNSYGFRPGRSSHDAIGAIFLSIRYKAKYVLDADIAKCFDPINHKALLDKINTYPRLRKQIKSWLKSGVLDQGEIFPTKEGTPQGGVISPLLANIALHGMEERIKQYAKTFKGGKDNNIKALSLIRYADDFVIMHENIDVILACQKIIADWLSDIGLELKSSKTKLTHTLNEYNESVGFEFLGFHIQQYKVGNYRSATNTNGTKLGFKTLITPSKPKVKTHLAKIADVIDIHNHAPQYALIKRLNPIIRGWSNYYSTVTSKVVYSKIDSLIYDKLRAWARRRGKGNINKNKYWRTVGDRNWCFSTEQGYKLAQHTETSIIRHVKVKGNSTPYDGNWIYWSKRRGEYPETPKRVATLLKKQKGKCTHCGLYFTPTDIVEVDHIQPRSLGGKDEYKNLQLLHKHCHDTKTEDDGSLQKSYDGNPF